MRPLQAHCHHRWNCSIPGPMLRLQKYSGQKVHLPVMGQWSLLKRQTQCVPYASGDDQLATRTIRNVVGYLA